MRESDQFLVPATTVGGGVLCYYCQVFANIENINVRNRVTTRTNQYTMQKPPYCLCYVDLCH